MRLASEKVSDNVRAVNRALDILMAFTATDYELSAGELLKRVDLSRPTLYRLLYTLEQSGFLVSVGDPQRFRLGPSVAHLAHVWTSSVDLGEVARPVLRRIWEQTAETVALFVPQGAYRTCIAELPSSQPLSFKRGVGYRERIVLGASGRAILAHADIGADELQEYAQGTGVDPGNYPEELELIRRRGYAISKEELIQGAVAIAAPFFKSGGQVAGSIAVFGPSARLDEARIEELGKLLVTEAEMLSTALGSKPA
jgi:IclR family transcriptional regulator, acetate operon repressor